MQGFFKGIIVFSWEVIKVVVISLAIVIPIRYFLIQPFFVKGVSMEPNFNDGEYLVINELNYRFGVPRRGDVVVLRYPADPNQYYIKRIIGLPGETIEIKNEGIFIYSDDYPQGAKLDESGYLKNGTNTDGNLKVELKKDEYFVLGDNRSSSSDSRTWGTLPAEFIVGKAFLRAFPFQDFSLFKTPHYGYLK